MNKPIDKIAGLQLLTTLGFNVPKCYFDKLPMDHEFLEYSGWSVRASISSRLCEGLPSSHGIECYSELVTEYLKMKRLGYSVIIHPTVHPSYIGHLIYIEDKWGFGIIAIELFENFELRSSGDYFVTYHVPVIAERIMKLHESFFGGGDYYYVCCKMLSYCVSIGIKNVVIEFIEENKKLIITDLHSCIVP